MAIILDGKKLSKRILNDLKRRIKKSGKRLRLAAVLVGNDKNSLTFLKQKEKACKFVGIDFQLYQFPANVSQKILEEQIKKIGAQKNHGIMVQLPLPKHIDTDEILNLIPQEKDVEKFFPPVLAGILALLKEYKINFHGKKVVVVGRGRLVGGPIVEWLEKQRIKVIEDTKMADIVISGVGKPGFVIRGNLIKKGAVVIDAAGDVDFESVFPKASYITPIPGGVGPMTVAMLLKNLYLLKAEKT